MYRSLRDRRGDTGLPTYGITAHGNNTAGQQTSDADEEKSAFKQQKLPFVIVEPDETMQIAYKMTKTPSGRELPVMVPTEKSNSTPMVPFVQASSEASTHETLYRPGSFPMAYHADQHSK